MSCLGVCGSFVAKAADVSVLTSATTGFCDPYFGAGCTERVPPCPYGRPVCDRGACAQSHLPGTADAAGDALDGTRG